MNKRFNRYLSLCTIIILVATTVFSQSDKCNCRENFETLKIATEKNYAGFPAKVKDKTSAGYSRLISAVQQRTISEQDPKKCFNLLKKYVRFFNDKHFILSYNNDKDFDNEKVVYTDTYIRERAATKRLNEIEGIWINADTSLKLAIQRDPGNVYKAIVLESRNPKEFPGLVYMTMSQSKNGYIAKAYNSFLTTEIPAVQTGNLLQIWNQLMLGKIYPEKLSPTELAELNTWRNNNHGLAFKQLSETTAYIKIPSFYNNDDKIQALVKAHDSIIKTCKNLIVDLRGNGGGSTGWVALVPYIQTSTITQPDTYLRITPDNTKATISDLATFVSTPIPDSYKKYFPDSIVAKYKKTYNELQTTNQSFYPIPAVIFPLDSILLQPAKIALVVDNLCGSSTEYFLFLSRQSQKTTSYGMNTIGMMDYQGMSNPTKLPYDKFILTIPIIKSSWTDDQPIDLTGFAPDKPLNNIPRKDWIEFIKNDLERTER